MYLKFGFVSLFFVSSIAFAGIDKKFATCRGPHHTYYLDLISTIVDNRVTNVSIKATTDADESELPAQLYQVVEVRKDGKSLPITAHSWVIRQAIKATASESFYGYVLVKAVAADKSVMFLNLPMQGVPSRNAMSIDGYIYSLQCPVKDIVD